MRDRCHQSPPAEAAVTGRVGYFVLQTRSEWHAGTLRITGVVENLATAAKQSFASAEQLAELLRDWK
jgi:hypothetical protein